MGGVHMDVWRRRLISREIDRAVGSDPEHGGGVRARGVLGDATDVGW